MGLFGSIGKVFGGALKIAGKVAGVASAVAPIPGLGFAGKIAGAAGKVISGARTVERTVNRIMPGGAAATAPVPFISTLNVMQDVRRRMTGNPLIPPSAARSSPPPTITARAEPMRAGYYDSAPGEPAPRKRRKKKRAAARRTTRRRRSSRRRSSRRRSSRRRLTRAQLRAGFGGKRRMRR